jgi:GAF domain-containing protein
MSDFILARVSQTLATEQSLETLVRQLLEMLEAVTRMESTYLTRIDINAQRQQIMFAHNSSEMQIPEGFSVPWMNPCANAPLRISARLATTSPVAGTPASPPRSWGSPPF